MLNLFINWGEYTEKFIQELTGVCSDDYSEIPLLRTNVNKVESHKLSHMKRDTHTHTCIYGEDFA